MLLILQGLEQRREASGASGDVACEGPSTSKQQGHHDLQGAQNISLQSPPNTDMTFSLEHNLKSVMADK